MRVIGKRNIPNLLTVGRGAITIIMVGLFATSWENKYIIIMTLFLTAAMTDFFDGWLARKYNCESDFGIVFDSMLDKVLILSMMMLLIPYRILPVGVWVLFFIREMVIDSIKGFWTSKGRPIKASWSGKMKLLAQVILIVLGLMRLMNDNHLLYWGTDLMAVVALFLSYYSGYFYVRDFVKKI